MHNGLVTALRKAGGGALLGLMVASCGSGCGGGDAAKPSPAASEGRSASLNAWLTSHQGDELPGVYHVESPDELQITAPRIKEVDGTNVTVRTDGKISLNLVGELDVGGKTPSQIAEILRLEYQKFYNKGTFDIAVRVSDYKSKTFFVAGQVVTPGIKKFTGNNTVVQVLAEAKLNDQAWPQKVIIVRQNENTNVKQKATVDVKAMFEKGDLRENFLIEQGDLIFVPPSPMAQFAWEAQKIIYPIIPVTNIASIAIRGPGF